MGSELDLENLWLTGHSLGGALATLYAAELRLKLGIPLGVCTFGSPRVGNQTFADLFKKARIPSIRVVCERDPVASQPPRKCFSFKEAARCGHVYKHVHGLVRSSYHGHLV